MKITRKQLRRVINEELRLITEDVGDDAALRQAMIAIKESAESILTDAGFPVAPQGFARYINRIIVKTSSDRPGAEVTIDITPFIQPV